jgi:hypothetical protein
MPCCNEFARSPNHIQQLTRQLYSTIQPSVAASVAATAVVDARNHSAMLHTDATTPMHHRLRELLVPLVAIQAPSTQHALRPPAYLPIGALTADPWHATAAYQPRHQPRIRAFGFPTQRPMPQERSRWDWLVSRTIPSPPCCHSPLLLRHLASSSSLVWLSSLHYHNSNNNNFYYDNFYYYDNDYYHRFCCYLRASFLVQLLSSLLTTVCLYDASPTC